jgi:allantoate deiminase
MKAGRIVQRIDELSAISESPDALTRICFSPEHRRAADRILGWMREAGLDARMDEIGNLIGRYEGETPGLPCLMLGSHFDTVRDAGRWDGPLGVLTALECLADIAARGLRLPFSFFSSFEVTTVSRRATFRRSLDRRRNNRSRLVNRFFSIRR